MFGLSWDFPLVCLKRSSSKVRAASLTTGSWIKGRNGEIYQVVDLVNGNAETQVTTFHPVDGQATFSVSPSLVVEYAEPPKTLSADDDEKVREESADDEQSLDGANGVDKGENG